MTSRLPLSRKLLFVLVTAAALLFVCLAGSLALVWVWSRPGQPEPLVDEASRPLPNSISEKTWVPINGVRQGMFVKSRDRSNPVLLYLHGGMPDYFLEQRYPTGLEQLFTVCYWDQRGAGLSYGAHIPAESITVEQLLSDVVAVSNHLRQRFGQDRIYLMGHSGGTFLGLLAVQRAPELYHAYVGVASVSNQLRSEQLAHAYMLERFNEQGNTRMVRALEAAPVTEEHGTPPAYLSLRDKAMHRLGIGTTRDMKSVVQGIFLRSLQNREYTLTEKLNLWRGKAATGVSSVWRSMIETDLSVLVPRVEIPVYFLHGIFDYTCSYTEAHAYFTKLQAPLKGFYTFTHSAHSPTFEEPAKVREILRQDVLTGKTTLADP